MTISTNDAIFKRGTQDVVSAGGGTSSVADAAFSASGDSVTWQNTENAPLAQFILTMQFPSGTITSGGIQLMARLLNNNGTTDEPPVSANWTGHQLTNFVTGTGMVATTDYAIVSDAPVELPSSKDSQEYEFYIRNSCGVTISSGWVLKIQPMAYGPSS